MFSRSGMLLLGVAAALAACVVQPARPLPPLADAVPIVKIKVPDRFPTIEVSLDTLRGELQKCLTTENPEARLPFDVTANFPEPKMLRYFSHTGSARQFMLSGTTAVCLERSVNGYPVLAGEAFLHTINPLGVPEAVRDEWNRRLATILAIQGSARVAYVYDNGAGFVARYWVEPMQPNVLHYLGEGHRSKALLAQESLDERFSHPDLNGVNTIGRTPVRSKEPGAISKSNLLSHRTEPEPPALRPGALPRS